MKQNSKSRHCAKWSNLFLQWHTRFTLNFIKITGNYTSPSTNILHLLSNADCIWALFPSVRVVLPAGVSKWKHHQWMVSHEWIWASPPTYRSPHPLQRHQMIHKVSSTILPRHNCLTGAQWNRPQPHHLSNHITAMYLFKMHQWSWCIQPLTLWLDSDWTWCNINLLIQVKP